MSQALDDRVSLAAPLDQRVELPDARWIDVGHRFQNEVEVPVLESEADEEDLAEEEVLERLHVPGVP